MVTTLPSNILLLVLGACLMPAARGFTLLADQHRMAANHPFQFSTALQATSVPPNKASATPPKKSSVDSRRKELFARKEPFWNLNRQTGRIEFGAPVPLENTKLGTSDNDLIASWIQDPDVFPMSIWQESHISKVKDHVYRLGLLTLNFVNLQFEPFVDCAVKTVADSKGLPVFTIQSVGFDPNPTEITFIPGMPNTLSLDDVVKNLDIHIEVVGQIRGATQGTGVKGRMIYVVTGKLPAALLLFPDPLLKAAADTITKEVTEFAQYSFRQGTATKFQEYQKRKLQA